MPRIDSDHVLSKRVRQPLGRCMALLLTLAGCQTSSVTSAGNPVQPAVSSPIPQTCGAGALTQAGRRWRIDITSKDSDYTPQLGEQIRNAVTEALRKFRQGGGEMVAERAPADYVLKVDLTTIEIAESMSQSVLGSPSMRSVLEATEVVESDASENNGPLRAFTIIAKSPRGYFDTNAALIDTIALFARRSVACLR